MNTVLKHLAVFLCVWRSGSSKAANNLVGYQCDGVGPSIRTISLVDHGTCNITIPATNQTRVSIQVIQLSDNSQTQAYTCYMTRSLEFKRCCADGHLCGIHPTVIEEPLMISREGCKKMVEEGSAHVDGHLMEGIKVGALTRAQFSVSGWFGTDGSCDGGEYNFRNNKYKNAVVYASYTILVQTYKATVNLATNSIVVKDSVGCTLSDATCYDALIGRTYWFPFALPCDKAVPYIIYEGVADKICPSIQSPEPCLLRVAPANKFAFTTRLLAQDSICGRIMWTTDYEKISVVELSPISPRFVGRKKDPSMIDMVLYFNTKLEYYNIHHAGQLRTIYTDVLNQLCKLELDVIAIKLELLRSSPFSSALVQFNDGMYARAVGEVAYIFKCEPTLVTLRHTSICYAALPVNVSGVAMFLSPITHILLNQAPIVDCSPMSPYLFKIGDHWLQYGPKYTRSETPAILSPSTKISHDIQPLYELTEAGIYSSEDLQKLKDYLLFPFKRETILTDTIRGVAGDGSGKYDFTGVFSKEGVQQMINSNIRYLWGKFTCIGQFFSGIFGIYVTIVGIKIIIQTAIRFYTLYSIIGLSWKLGASIRGACTTCIIAGATKVTNPGHQPEAVDKASAPEGEEVDAHLLNEVKADSKSIYPALPLRRSAGHN